MLIQDLRYAVRTLRRSGGFTTVALLSLALGIGANTAIFSLIDALVMRKLPVKNADGLYIVGSASAVNSMSYGSQRTENFSYPTYKHLLERNQLFSYVVVSGDAGRLNLSIQGKKNTAKVRGRMVSGGYFPMLGVSAQIGRVLTPDDDRLPGAHPVIVISDGFWHRVFAGRPDIVGQNIELNGRSYSIIGVTPPAFTGEVVGQSQDIWAPVMMQEAMMPGRAYLDDFRRSWLQMMVRLKPGVTEQQARVATDVLIHQIMIDQEGPNASPEQLRSYKEDKIAFQSGGTGYSRLRANFQEPLFILMSVVGLVLLIACANVANLLLARATGRQKEIGIRIALGAARRRLIRQMLTESLLLALAGSALGLLMARWAGELLLHLVNSDGVPLALKTDLPVLGFTAGVAILTGLLFGVAPALRATRVDISSGLKETSRGLTSSGSRLSFGKLLVVGQVALSLLLLIGAGLFVRSLQNLLHVDLGYERDHLLLLYIDGTAAGYKGARATQLWRQVLEQAGQLPGVKAATFSGNGLFSGSESGAGIDVEGFRPSGDKDRGARFDQVAPNYFEAVGIPVLKGRAFNVKDDENAPRVAVINQAMAKFYFGGKDPIGRHFTYEDAKRIKTTREIVGVVRDVRDHSLKDQIARRFYVPAFQPFASPLDGVILELRTRADPTSMIAAARAAILKIDSTLPVLESKPLSLSIAEELAQERLVAQLSTFFGLLALTLAALGLYGVMSYAMARRTNEIGIRMALGAQPGNVLGMVMGESLLLVAGGVVIGLPCAIGLARLVSSRLFGLQSWDPGTLGAAAAILLIVAALAALIPALRAARLNPVTALHYE